MIAGLRVRELVTIGAAAAAAVGGSAVALAHRSADAEFLQEQRNPRSLDAAGVERVVRSAPDPRTGQGTGTSAACRRGSRSELGNPWSCVVTYRDGHKVRLRVRVSADGTYTGRYARGGGATGCCVDLPGTR